MRKIVLLFALLLLASPAWAMRQPIFGGQTTAPSTSAVNFSGFRSAWVATNDNTVQAVSPMDGVFEGIYVQLPTAPDNGGGTQSYTFNLHINDADKAITCTASEAQSFCQDFDHLVPISAGDTFSIKSTPSGTPASAGLVRFTLIFNSRTGGGSMVYTSANNVATATGSAETVNAQSNIGWGQSNLRTVIPTSGTISNFYVVLTTAPGSGGSGKQYVINLNLNGNDTAVTCTDSETATTCNDTGHNFAVVAGDLLRVKTTPSNTPASTRMSVGYVFTPTIDGESFYGSANQNSPSASVDTYFPLQGYNSTNTTETSIPLFVIPQSGIVVKKLYHYTTGGAPGSGKSIVHTLRKELDVTTVTCTETGTSATNCQDTTHTLSPVAGDRLSISFGPVNTPTVGATNYYGTVFFMDPKENFYGSDLYGATIY